MKESHLSYYYEYLAPESEWIFVTPSQEASMLNTTVQEVGEFFSRGKHYTHRGPLDSFQICFSFSDSIGTILYRGKKHSFPGENELTFIDCSDGHNTDTLGNGHFVFLHFQSNGLKELYNLFYDMNGKSPIVKNVSKDIVSALFLLLKMYKEPNGFITDLNAELIITQMVMDIMRPLVPSPLKQYSKHVQTAVNIINEEYSKPLSLDTLAKKCYVSKFYLLRSFKKETGVTPNEYLTNLRLGKAKELLQNTNMSQEMICDEIGICNCSYLSKLFLAYEQQTPGEYRKKWR